jgi:Flp pilus assembly protein TadG
MLSRRVSGPESDQGFALVEMAIASAVLVLIVFASLEGGIMLYDQGIVSAASREAARSGIVLRTPRLTDSQIQTVAQGYADSLIGFAGSSFSTAVTHPTPDSIGTPLKVTVTYQYSGLVLYALVNRFSSTPMKGTIPIVGTTTMYLE